MVIKVVVIAFVGIFSSVIIKKFNSEISLLISIITAIIIFMEIYQSLSSIVSTLFALNNNKIIDNVIETVIKAIGIGYLIEFAADAAEDSGNKMISNSVIIAGRIIIAVLAIPIIKIMFDSILSLL